MHIELETLYDYKQYVGEPICYYFDRKTYQIVDADSVEERSEDPYERYLPLFQIDEERMQEAYILQLNRKDILYAYRCQTGSFRSFADTYGLWQDWWQYEREKVRQCAIEWCEKNHIRYQDRIS